MLTMKTSRVASLGQAVPVVRFIVTDELGERFIQGAKVSVVLEDGTVLLSKMADQGGNVAFGKREVIEAATKVGYGEGYRGPSLVSWYTVEAPGYVLQDGMFFDPMKPQDVQLNKIYTVALKKAEGEGSSGLSSNSILLPGLVLLGVAGILIYKL